ncbi:hypothetical protein DRE_06013 [Drechslerella stenobrocha 248]|uniref:DH domain-containing protein n=1 Tax=Drechslerella stenobrocha 248 TaxID=1043628 RepID=W7HMQ9_9PEZI|nr:hypothetical protein DRE_06013 [Drechslerella stenobrocha 248]
MTIELDQALLMKTHAAGPAASPRISSTISTSSSQTLVNSHASISTISSISTTSTFVNGNSAPFGHASSPIVASPAITLGPSIPTATDSLINKQADASQSLYQICMNLKKRLELLPEVKKHLEEFSTDPEDRDLPADPVYQLWQTFRNGASLAYLSKTLTLGTVVKESTEVPDSLNKKKKLVFQFLKEANEKLNLSGDDIFMITHLYGEDTNGFVKVAKVVSLVLDELEKRGLLAANDKLAEHKTDMASLDKRGKTVAEFLDTERKYVQDLEALQDYMHALQAAEIVSNDTIHSLFLNLNHLLDFQRKFLVRLEMMYDMPPEKQKWGSLFQHYESAFGVYEDFCANFKHAQDLAIQEAPRLNKLDHPLNRAGVGGFLIKPPQRICRYTLLLESILKASAPDDPRRQDLEDGLKTVVSINTKVNEAVGKLENAEVVVELRERVEDWKGHQINHFGDLLLFGQFTVIKGDAKGDIEREYHIYLFERILLCCKEIGASKKPKSGMAANRKKGKLQLKGRIFMQNVTDIISLAKNGSYTLQIFWKGDPGVENFIIRQRNEELLKQWNNFLHRQVALWKRDDMQQVKSERPVRFPTSNTEFYWTVGTNVPQPADDPDTSEEDDDEDDDPQLPDTDVMSNNRGDPGAKYPSAGSPAGFPPPKQLKYPVSSSSAYMQPQSTTPLSATTSTNGMSYFSPSESPMPTPQSRQTSGQYPFTKPGMQDNGAPMMTRSTSREGNPLSAAQAGQRIQRPSLPGIAQPQSVSQQNRMRSASSPNIHPLPSSPLGRANAMAAPPLPNMQAGLSQYPVPSRMGNQSPSLYSQVQHLNTLPENPRVSGMVPHISTMHQDYIPRNGTPPSEGIKVGGDPASMLRQMPVPSLKVKVSYITDMFVIIVPQNIGYTQLMDRIERKVRLCGGATYSSNNPLRVRYQDEDGDYITVNSDEDVQMAIESRFHGSEDSLNAVTLFVA